MQSVTIICLGKLKESYLRDACSEYQKRLQAFCNLRIEELTPVRLPDNPGEAQIAAALETEAKMIGAKIPAGARVYAMCIEGKQFSSEKFSQALQNDAITGNSQIIFVIGSSYGLSPAIKKQAKQMSMSEMTFPHQLARVMLLEQIYRAFQIANGGKYHK